MTEASLAISGVARKRDREVDAPAPSGRDRSVAPRRREGRGALQRRGDRLAAVSTRPAHGRDPGASFGAIERRSPKSNAIHAGALRRARVR